MVWTGVESYLRDSRSVPLLQGALACELKGRLFHSRCALCGEAILGACYGKSKLRPLGIRIGEMRECQCQYCFFNWRGFPLNPSRAVRKK